ncbi:MAG: suhb [Epsilonproteobacteria bacterium]|nr:suhb [Campylobacterota bacterium]
MLSSNFIDAALCCSLKVIRALHEELNLFEEKGIGYGGDRSLNIDLIAEKIFIKKLSEFGNILSEEAGFIDNGKDKTIIIDPIDGSYNVSNNIPYFGTSLYLEDTASVVVNLSNGDYFVRDENGKRFENLFRKQYYANFRNDVIIFEKAYKNPDIVAKLAKHNLKFRAPGALSLSLCYGEASKAVIYKGEIREFDIAAAKHYNSDCFWHFEDDLIVMAPRYDDLEEIVSIIKE